MDDIVLTLPYNGTVPTGGDSLNQNLNVYYEVSTAIFLPSTILMQPDLVPSSPAISPGCWQQQLSSYSWSRELGTKRTSNQKATAHAYDYRSFFYSGLARRKSALSLIWVTLMAVGVTSFQWFFWGYSLAFSHSAGKFIGDLSNIGFRNVLAAPSVTSQRIPDLLFAVYQGMFASIT